MYVVHMAPLWPELPGRRERPVRLMKSQHCCDLHSRARWIHPRPGGRAAAPGHTAVDPARREPEVLQSSIGPEDLYLAHGRGDGFAPQLHSLGERAPTSECPGCTRGMDSYDMAEVIGDFGS